MHKKLTIEQIKSRLPSHTKIDESTYITTKKKARFIDDQYGEFWTKVSSVLKGTNHPTRGRLNSVKKQTMDIEEIKKRLPDIVTIITYDEKETLDK